MSKFTTYGHKSRGRHREIPRPGVGGGGGALRPYQHKVKLYYVFIYLSTATKSPTMMSERNRDLRKDFELVPSNAAALRLPHCQIWITYHMSKSLHIYTQRV